MTHWSNYRRKRPKTTKAGTRRLAHTFWGNAWCENLEHYSDYDNRLPRGRTYFRQGSVRDLAVEKGRITARVMGTSLYRVSIDVKPLPDLRWAEVKRACAGQITSLVEMLSGALPSNVMKVVTGPQGLFPAQNEINLRCSCPDWAVMCKHVAAVLYGVGALLDDQPELLFTLRGVDPGELVEAAVVDPLASSGKSRRLRSDDLGQLFGIEVAGVAPPVPVPPSEGVLALLNEAGQVTPRQVMETLGLTRPQVKVVLDQLVAQNKLRRVGERGPRVHYVAASVPAAPASTEDQVWEWIRQVGQVSTGDAMDRWQWGLPRARTVLEQMVAAGRLQPVAAPGSCTNYRVCHSAHSVIDLARTMGQITTSAVESQLRLSRVQAKALLEELRQQGSLQRVGERGRGVHYVLS